MGLDILDKKLALVTGAGGLLGTHLVNTLLKNGYAVRAMYHSQIPDLSHENLEKIQVDILDVIGLGEAMKYVDHVYHCAGLVSFEKKDRNKIYHINVEGTANVVNMALDAGVKKMVHVSSVAALPITHDTDIRTETMGWVAQKDKSIYGHSKFLGEMEVWRAMAEGLNAVIINPSVILGSGDWNKGSAKIFKTVYEEFPWYTEGVNGFVGVDDVAEIMVRVMNSEITEQRYIVNAENISYRDLFTMIANAFGKKPPTKQVNLLLANMVMTWQQIQSSFTGKSPFITKETIATATNKVYYNNEKLLNALPGFNYTPLSTVVKNTCAYFKQKINNQ